MSNSLRFFDSHAHLSPHYYKEGLDDVIKRAKEAKVLGIVTIGGLEDWQEALHLARRYDWIWAAIGIHPHEAREAKEETFEALETMLNEDKVVAVGEIGLDYHYLFSSKAEQLQAFERQIEMARRLGLPVVIHCREAHEDCLHILEKAGLGERPGVIHCFTGDLETARKYIALGFSISIPGVITFRNVSNLVEAVKGIAVERLLIETDSPYLSPEPYRGRQNEPANVPLVAKAIAEVKGLSLEDVARITDLNARILFGIENGRGLTPRLVYPIRNSLYINMTNRCTLHCTFCGKFRDFIVKGHNLRIGRDPSVEAIWKALLEEDPLKYSEVVFCGYGEPLLRPDEVREIAMRLRRLGVRRIRINTDGLAELVHGRPVLEELSGLIDVISVSMNAPDAETYARYCRSKYGASAYESVLSFIRRAKQFIPEVVATVVALPGLDIEACRKVAEEELRVKFRVRPLDDIG